MAKARKIICPMCGAALKLRSPLRRVRCPECGEAFDLVEEETTTSVPRPVELIVRPQESPPPRPTGQSALVPVSQSGATQWAVYGAVVASLVVGGIALIAGLILSDRTPAESRATTSPEPGRPAKTLGVSQADFILRFQRAEPDFRFGRIEPIDGERVTEGRSADETVYVLLYGEPEVTRAKIMIAASDSTEQNALRMLKVYDLLDVAFPQWRIDAKWFRQMVDEAVAVGEATTRANGFLVGFQFSRELAMLWLIIEPE
jgi:hypothetical protein